MTIEIAQIKMIPVESSQIESVGYDAESQVMQVRFRPKTEGFVGALYRYRAVGALEYLNLLNAQSVGKYFNATFRNPAKYPFTRQDEKPITQEPQA